MARYYAERIHPASHTNWAAFRRTFGERLRVVELDLPGWVYIMAPGRIEPHIRRFLDDVARGAHMKSGACFLATAVLVAGLSAREAIAQVRPRAGVDSDAALARAAARLPLEPCALPGVQETVLCGELERAENPEVPGGRTISIFVVVVPALSPNPAPDPWVEITGGPGVPATGEAGYFTGSEGRAYRQTRDVLLVDQRGIGRSNGLHCEELAIRDDVSVLFPRWPADSVRSCRERVSARADLAQYSTAHAADDLEAVRQWLGYPRLNLFGVSYGTRAALTFMRRHPSSVRSAMLLGVVPPDFRRPLYYARDAQHTLELLLKDCHADVGCASAFPDVRSELAQVLEALERAPIQVSLTHPATGAELPSVITSAGFAEVIWAALMSPADSRRVPLMIHYAARGDFAPFLWTGVADSPPQSRYYNAAHLSIVCPEETLHVRPEEIEALHQNTFMPATRTYEYLRACQYWGVPPLLDTVLAPVASGVPTLVVSGYMDPVTPPALGDQVARHLTNARHLVIRHRAHGSSGLTGTHCMHGIYLRFVDDPDPAGLDTSCTAEMEPPPFALKP
jgi:pimeloyl-ACP methyl ester carboxylesterase